jgi:lipoprotein NlpI
MQIRVELNPLDIEAYNLMGMIYLQHKESKAKAQQCFNCVLSLSPSNLVARHGLTSCD